MNKVDEVMIKLLKECYQRELNGLEPCNPLTHGFADELLVNGLLTLHSYTYSKGERKATYLLTEKGRKFIEENFKDND